MVQIRELFCTRVVLKSVLIFQMSSHNRVTTAGLLIALGIIYGDIGTSPLYVLNAIISGKIISEELIIGASQGN